MARGSGPTLFRDFVEDPLVGGLDLRSPNGAVLAADYRLCFNWTLNEQRGRCRRYGWKRLFADSPFGFKNQDLHDQLILCQNYYNEYSYSVAFGGGLIDYAYLDYVAGYTIPGTITSSFYGPLCGYAWDNVPPFTLDTNEFDKLVVTTAFAGYPYTITPLGPVYCPAGPGDEYQGSYYDLLYSHRDPDIVSPPYEAGLVGVYEAPYSVSFSYCESQVYGRDGCREAITLLGQVTSENETRKLVAGTKSRLYVLNERTANWHIIADGLGGPLTSDNCQCSERRFSMATLGGYSFFTNNYNPLLYWQFDAPTTGCDLWSAQYVSDLTDLGITRVRCVCEFAGFLLVGNVEQDGLQRPFRIFWSDFNAPLSFLPGIESLAGFTDLKAGEQILRIEKLGGSARIYTDRAIYAVSMVGGSLTFNMQEIYSGPNVLRFAYSLANGGDVHYFMSQDSIYRLTESDRSPVLVEWIHKSAGAIYKGVDPLLLKQFTGISSFLPINRDVCDAAVGYYRKETDEVFFSWPTGTNTCPDKSLCLNVRYGGADIIDHGFTAFFEFISDPKTTVIEWLIDTQLCSWADFVSQMIKEGEPYSMDVDAFPNPPTSIINATEDPTLPIDPNSWLAQLCNITPEDLCKDCSAGLVFIGASALDKCLKEFDPNIFYRERYVDAGGSLPCPQTVVGTYVLDGYTSLLQKDLHDYGQKEDKLINKIEVDFDALPQTSPGQLVAQVGYAANAACTLWSEVAGKNFACPNVLSDDLELYYKERPNLPAVYKFFRRGRYLAWRLSISGTGSGGCISRLTKSVRLAQGVWP